MTDTRSRSAAAPAPPPPDCSPPTAIEKATSLRALVILLEAFQTYKSSLAKHVMPYPVRHHDDEKKRDAHYDRLVEPEAVNVLSVLWKESDYITLEDLELAEMSQSFPETGVTRNALGDALEQSDCRPQTFNSSVKYIRRAARIVEAAITYGLVEPEDKDRPNFKPLRATARLHAFMTHFGSDIDSLINPANQGENCSDNSPENGEGEQGL
jgi:hypothetical protein